MMNLDLSLLRYDNGALYWTEDRRPRHKAGDRAGTVRTDGRRSVGVNQTLYLEYRVIFFMHHGYWPKEVDHINGDPTDNRIENLRAATRGQNARNTKAQARNKLGVKNVYQRGKKYRVMLTIDKAITYFGSHDSLEFAELVAIEAREKHHGEFANHGNL